MVKVPAHNMSLVTERRPRCYTSTHVLVSSMIFGHKQMSSCSQPQLLGTRSRLNGTNLKDSFADSMFLGCRVMSKRPQLEGRPCKCHASWLQKDAQKAKVSRTPLRISCFLFQTDVRKTEIWRMPLLIKRFLITRSCLNVPNMKDAFADSIFFLQNDR